MPEGGAVHQVKSLNKTNELSSALKMLLRIKNSFQISYLLPFCVNVADLHQQVSGTREDQRPGR